MGINSIIVNTINNIHRARVGIEAACVVNVSCSGCDETGG